jgi:hypothetical protein
MAMTGRGISNNPSVVAAVVTVASIGYLAALTAQNSPGVPLSPQDLAVVCYDGANVLHARNANSGCAPREIGLPVMATHVRPGPSSDDLDFTDWPSPPPKPDPHAASLAELEQRVARLNKNAAFLTVVDKQGNKIFEVTSDAAALYHSDSRQWVAAMRATAQGGSLATRSTAGPDLVNIGAVGTSVGVRIIRDGVPLLDLGRRESGNYALKVRTLGGATDAIAAIGESLAGTGAIVVATPAGHPKASIRVDQGRGEFNVFDEGGRAIASLRQAQSEHGFLSLGVGGSEAVKMVVNGNYGAVLAGPVLGFPLVPSSGLPGSYILGCAGGPACHP